MNISRQAIVNFAIKTVQNGNNRYKDRWLKAVESAKNIFLVNDEDVSADIHKRLEQYQTTIHTCGCKAASTGYPCYHRAYLLLQLRYAEWNGSEHE
jgi:hypothetical protein